MASKSRRTSLNLLFNISKAADVFSDSRIPYWIQGLFVFSLFILLMSVIQFSTSNLVGTDGYYHIKIASLMRIEGLKPAFPWLPLTILNPGEFVDHHFLFHVLLIPFTFGDLIIGAKLASVVFASLAFLSIWWLLHNQKVPYAGLWALSLLAISEAFLYRMSMPRAQSLSLALLVLGLNFLLVRKYLYLFPLAFVFVWMYDAFPLLIVLTLLYTLSVWLIERKLLLQPLFYVLMGVFLGLFINPYFPHNIVFFIRHLLPKILSSDAVRVGNEWYPYETGQLLENSPIGLLIFLSGIVAIGLHHRRMDTRTATVLFIAIFFGILLFQSRRFIEYFPPFALIFAALAWDPLISSEKGEGSGQLLMNRVIPEFSDRISRTTRSNIAWMVGVILTIVFLTGTWFTGQDARQSVMGTKPAGRYAQASSWLVEHTPAGTRIFQTDWDDFPRLFFYNTHNTYLVGLDPTYLRLKDPDLFELWVEITKGNREIPSEPVLEEFAAGYVFTDTAHKKFIERALADPGLERVYQDDEAMIFQVLTAGG